MYGRSIGNRKGISLKMYKKIYENKYMKINKYRF